MKILVLSNLYPPHGFGGYEERCRTSVQGLRERGHHIQVLTSQVGMARPAPGPDAEGIWRALIPVGYFGFPWVRMPGLARVEAHNHARLRTALAQVGPDAVWVWNLGGLGKSLLATAAAQVPLVCDLSDEWVLRGLPSDPWLGWSSRHPRWSRLAGLLARGVPRLRPEELPLGRAYCTSYDLRTRTAAAGFPALARVPVIHCGIEVERFTAPIHERDDGPLRCLYVGRLHPDKGVHTACAGVAACPQATLDVYGSGEPDYEARLRLDWGSHPRIKLRGHVPAGGMPAVYRGYHCLVFPSEWPEPFALTPLEASAAGLVVAGTLTGGSGEFLREGDNALTWRAGQADDLTRVLTRLAAEPELGRMLASRAQAEVAQRFTLGVMLDAMESHLHATVGR